jgi:hypothetical protein
MFKMAPHPLMGFKVKDKVTGFTGTVTGAVQYISGCDQLSVQGAVKGNEKGISMWLDINRAVKVKSTQIILETTEVQGAGDPPTKS